MRIGMIGLGRMGASMATRLLADRHECIVYDREPDRAPALAESGAIPAGGMEALVDRLPPPRAIWMMVPAAAVDGVVESLAPLLSAGDVLVDGGNSWFQETRSRAARLADTGIELVDVGVSGGVRGRDNGYCLMIGGSRPAAERLLPVFATLAPGGGGSQPALDRPGDGYLWCGPSGAGHYVKMVHNGIEYGQMAAYAEGFNLLAAADGRDGQAAARSPGYELDIAAIAEVWRHGSVIRSWLLDLAAASLHEDSSLSSFEGRVGDSGEGRWTVQTAIDAAVPLPVISAALYARFGSRGRDDFANRLLSALRHAFGGHREN